MRTIKSKTIIQAVRDLCLEANLVLRPDVLAVLKKAYAVEKNRRAKRILKAILDNAAIAKKEKLAICQDTGLATVFVELGQEVRIKGDLRKAVNKGIEEGYRKGYMRNSIIQDPLRRGRSSYAPGMIHLDLVKGNKIKITVLPKGFGCENKSQLKMFNPTAKLEEIKKFVIEVVKSAGPDACPPYVVGVGIGGTADYACFLAKKALLKKIVPRCGIPLNQNLRYGTNYQLPVTNYERKLEYDLLKEINKLSIGPMGLGGKTTALAMNILTHPTHIAGLPVAVNISCHALRSATRTL